MKRYFIVTPNLLRAEEWIKEQNDIFDRHRHLIWNTSVPGHPGWRGHEIRDDDAIVDLITKWLSWESSAPKNMDFFADVFHTIANMEHHYEYQTGRKPELILA